MSRPIPRDVPPFSVTYDHLGDGLGWSAYTMLGGVMIRGYGGTSEEALGELRRQVGAMLDRELALAAGGFVGSLALIPG